MPLKYHVEKETEVPAEHKSLYHEREVELANGTKVKMWVLDVEDVVPKGRFVEFRENNRALKSENDSLKEKFKGIEDPDRARALLNVSKGVELDDAEQYLRKGGVDAMIVERTKAIKEDMENKLKQANSRADAAQAKLEKTTIENSILNACRQLSLQPGAEMAILRFADGVWSLKDGNLVALDRNGNPRSNRDGTSNLGITEWLQDELLKQHTYLAKESSGAGASGSGSSGSGTPNVNPWSKKTFNLTLQGKITKENPELARRMKEQAQREARIA